MGFKSVAEQQIPHTTTSETLDHRALVSCDPSNFDSAKQALIETRSEDFRVHFSDFKIVLHRVVVFFVPCKSADRKWMFTSPGC